MPRTPISANLEDEEGLSEGGTVDATMLPPG